MKNIKSFKEIYIINEELDFKIIPTKYISKYINGVDTFTFITNKNNSYTVYIEETTESNHLLNNGEYLQDINNNKTIPTIYFSETDRILDPSTFNNLTNYSEYMEVMGKVIYIISEFIKNNQQYSVFSIGEVDIKKFNFYKNWLGNLPITRFEIGLSDNYIDDKNNKTKAYYLIR